MAAFAERVDGQTTIGSNRTAFSVLAVNAGTASALKLVDSSGVEWCFWVQSNVLTFGTYAQFIAQSGGSAV